jgi:two-component system, cell cycle sensor histidine kinase and response regulator CckA
VLTNIPDWIPLTFLPLVCVVAIWVAVLWRVQLDRTARLAVEERRYRNLFENARDILFTLDPTGVIQTVNQSIERVTGRKSADVVGTSFADLAADDDARKLFAAHLERAVHHRSSGTTQIRVTGRHPNSGASEDRILELSSHGLPETGTVEVIQGMARDVTMRKQLEQGKIKTEQLEAVSRMSGGIAHDFNNILTIIRGYAEQIREADGDQSPHEESVEIILSAARRAELLTLQLMGLSRHQLSAPEPIDIHELIHATLQHLAQVLPEDITLQESLLAETPNVFASRGSIEQIFLNLALNARDALPNGGTLTLETRRQDLAEETVIDDVRIGAGRYVVVTVSDDGVGMDEATTVRIFEPFYSTKNPGRGAGLGLATVQSAMTRMGGHVLVASSPDCGAQFTLYLPWSSLSPSSDQPGAGSSRVGERVLLVEDDEQVRHLMDRALRASGYEVTMADSVETALMQPEMEIDAVVTDLTLAGMTGAELAARMRERNPDVPVLFVSGLAPQQDTTSSLPRTRFINKPLEPERLAVELRALLDASDAEKGETDGD